MSQHLLQTAIEAMMDIAGHILARRRLPTPHEGGETFRRQDDVDDLRQFIAEVM